MCEYRLEILGIFLTVTTLQRRLFLKEALMGKKEPAKILAFDNF